MTAESRTIQRTFARPAQPAETLASRDVFIPLHAVAMGLVLLVCLGTLALGLYEARSSFDAIAVGCGLAVLGLAVYARYVVGLSWLSASIVYLVLFWSFHYGLAFTSVLVPSVLDQSLPEEVSWLYLPSVRVTMILAVIGAAGFVFGAGVFARRPASGPPAAGAAIPDPVTYAAGCLLLFAGFVAVVFTIVSHGGLVLFSMGYEEVRRVLLGPPDIQTAVELSQLGCLLALSASAGRQWIGPVAAWTVVIGGLLLLLGMRNLVMVPMVTFPVVLAARGIRLPRTMIAGGVLLLVVITPIIREVRTRGAGATTIDLEQTSPLETFTELGGTLRAAKAYVERIDAGEPLLYGASYWSPFERQILAHVIPDYEQVPADDDVRMPGRLVSRYEGAVGTSATGEAYYNFGAVGPFIYFGCVGALFGWIERRRGSMSTPRAAILGVVMIVFYFNIRAEWILVPARLAIGVGTVYGCQLLRRLVPYAPAPAFDPS